MQILLTFFLSASITLAVVHMVAQEFFLYWKYTWFDVPMHVLGGVCVALGYATLPFFRIKLSSKYGTLFAYLVLAFLVGALWELFEYMTGISVVIAGDDFALDTALDLILDLFGGALGYGIVKQIHKL